MAAESAAGDQSGLSPEEARDLGTSPARISDPRIRHEYQRAFIWAVTIGAVALTVYLSSALLAIFGAMVFAALIDGGARLLGRVLPLSRGWRVAIVLTLTLIFLAWLLYFAGSTISTEAALFPELIQNQIGALIVWAQSQGIDVSLSQLQGYAGQMSSGMGTVTRAVGGILGGLTTTFLIAIIGIYLAVEPRSYERGMAWMLPRNKRDGFFETIQRMGFTMRRLLAGRLIGMAAQGFITYVALAWLAPLVVEEPVPMAALLGILTALFAFVPNLGAIISGALMVLVGFSGGVDMGLYTIAVYLVIQTLDGYVFTPMIAKKTVDLAPALVLAMQLIMGILFGVIGLLLADPLLAMIKVALERRAESNATSERVDAVIKAAGGT
ncbi:AI-2E family transporter [Qipengyuania sediminis]|uniref:AI-2E family transporter n=1 Tax=Qipengyuania sediminis TaxID=1532023 RepID=UPI0010592D41|nr:AI-2E family transporter [Qipengyuania sediminis]